MIRRVIRAGDRWLSRRQGIAAFSDDPRCMFRARTIRTRTALQFPGTRIPAGTPVLELHTFNERMPELPMAGSSLQWAARARGLMRASMRLLAEHVANEPALMDVRGVVGFTALFEGASESATERFFQRFGFETAPMPHRFGRFGELGLNIHAWMIMWAYNRGSTRSRAVLQLRHSMLWIPRAALLERWLDA